MRTDSPARARPVFPARLAVLAALAGLTGLAGLTACSNSTGAAQGAPSQTLPAVGASTTAPASPPTPAGGTSPAGTTAPAAPVRTGSTGSTHRPAPAGSCQARDLVLVSIQSDGGSGSAFQTVTVKNAGMACRLPNIPSMVYTDTGGTTRKLPTSPQVPNPPAMLLQHGHQAQFTIRTVNGYGGYDPSSAACAHPAKYQNIALTFSDGRRLALTGMTLDVLCDGITVTGWSAPPAS